MKGYKKMGQTEKGVLIFSEWFEAMEDLKVTEFKRLIYAIYRLQIFGEEPPEFQEKAKMIASIIFPMIRRRMELAQYGSLGAAKRLSASKNEAESNPDKDGQASTEAATEASSQGASPLEAKEKNRKEKNRIPYSPSSESSKGDARGARRAYARGGKAAKSEKDEFFDEFFELAVKRALGENA